MRTGRKGTLATIAGLAGLGLVSFILLGGPPPAHDSSLLAASPAAQEFQIAPDTMVGWGRGPEQPVFFSHRRHAGVYGVDCLYCHTNTDVSQVAPMPSLALCFGCHRVIKAGSPEIQTLRGYQERGEPVEWVRIHKLPDFVQFNHSRHVRADLECQNCHGNVEEMDVVYQVESLTMGWCLDCHWQEADSARRARYESYARRFAEPGREDHGLYPKSIDSDYGVTRAPIDCVACHY